MKDILLFALLVFLLWVWAYPMEAVIWWETLTGMPAP